MSLKGDALGNGKATSFDTLVGVAGLFHLINKNSAGKEASAKTEN